MYKAMNHRYNALWWASEGDGPLGSGPDNPQLNSGRTLQILESLCGNGSLYTTETRYGGRKYAKVEVKGGRIYINSFHNEGPDPGSKTETRFIPFPELMSRFNNGSSPKSVFLRMIRDDENNPPDDDDIYDDEDDNFEIVIKTDANSWRAQKFVLLCSALINERSYKGLTWVGCPSFYQICAPPYPFIKGHKNSKTTLKEGGLYGNWDVFFVPLRDNPSITKTKLGDVVEGLEVMKNLRRRTFTIEECGLVI